MAERKLNHRNFIVVICASLIVLIETLCLALAGAWAIAGLSDLNDYLVIGVEVLFGLIAVWLSWKFFKTAAKTEPIWHETKRSN